MSPETLGLLIGLVAVTGGLAVGAFIVYLAIKHDTVMKEAINKERLALIEKGMDPTILDKPKPKDNYMPLLWGLLLSGIGLGALVGNIIAHYLGDYSFELSNVMALLFGGAGLILFYFIKRKNTTNQSF